GIDIIELSRIQKSVQKNHRIVQRILTDREIKNYENLSTERRKVEYLAGRFAAKEAFAKANGTGIGELSFRDIQVLSNANGKPQLFVNGYDSEHLFISISHSEHYVIAQVIIEKTSEL
ncbi:MAG TPA: holo-ACP synthase, partial [Pseudogracilibacillus sp.]|nr:holo-ACP synthase [Pseudogracilibacillus sp.]